MLDHAPGPVALEWVVGAHVPTARNNAGPQSKTGQPSHLVFGGMRTPGLQDGIWEAGQGKDIQPDRSDCTRRNVESHEAGPSKGHTASALSKSGSRIYRRSDERADGTVCSGMVSQMSTGVVQPSRLQPAIPDIKASELISEGGTAAAAAVTL